jgi:hypothetical protein
MLLKKSVRANDPNFSVTWARLPKKYVGGPPRSLTIERAASATAVRSLSATPVNDHVHCRDFRRLPFSEFFNNIRQKGTPSTLSVVNGTLDPYTKPSLARTIVAASE